MKVYNVDNQNKILKKSIIIAIVLLIFSIIVNILLVVFRNDNNHYYFLVLNILIDIISLWIITYLLLNVIIPTIKIIKMKNNNHGKVKGIVTNISNKTIHYMGYDCYEIELDNKFHYYLFDKKQLELKQNIEFIHYNYLILEVYNEKDNF